MSANIPRELIEAAVGLRAQAPETWQRFLAGMRLYSAGITNEMVRADANLLMRAQGMAMGLQEINNILNAAPNLYETMNGRIPHGQKATRT